MLVSEKLAPPIPGLSRSLTKILEKLVQAGVPVESVQTRGKDITPGGVAELLEVNNIPRPIVFRSPRSPPEVKPSRVVCGAKTSRQVKRFPCPHRGPSCRVILPSKPRKIRERGYLYWNAFVSSQGSGLAEDAEGIFIPLPARTLRSERISSSYSVELPDTLFELEIVPNPSRPIKPPGRGAGNFRPI